MPYPVSARFIQTLMGTDQKRISTAEIWNGNKPLAGLGTVTDGSVSIDVTQPIRRTMTATVVSQGLEMDDLVPTGARSLLNPASGNELRLFRGFEYDDGTQELCPLGVFRMTRPTVADTGDGITISITGNDRSFLIGRRTWTDVFPIHAGTDLRTAVQNLLQSRGKNGDLATELGLRYKFASTPGVTVPSTTFGATLASSNNPWQDAISLAVVGSFELFFDEVGDPVMQLIPNATLPSSSFPFAYQEGDNCTYVNIQRALDETQTNNGVIVVGVGSGGAPVTAEVWDTDPSSPLWYMGPWGKQPYIYQTALVPSAGQSTGGAQAQALKMAQTIYRQVHTLLDIPSFNAVPNPALLESDILHLVRARIGLDAPYVCGQITMPLDTATLMTVTARTPTVILPTS